MTRHNSILALTTLVVIGLAGPALAEHGIPLKGNFEGDVTVTPLVPPNVFVEVDAEGHATQLGHFTVTIPHQVNRDKKTAHGFYTFTAANGDTLTAEFDGKSTTTPIPGVLYIEETATIISGTGRFTSATGTFTVERFYDMVDGTTDGSLEGTIVLSESED